MVLAFLLLFAISSFATTLVAVGDFTDKEKLQLLAADSLERASVEKRIVARFENSGFPAAKIVESVSGDTLYVTLERGEGFVFGTPRNAVAGKTSPEVFAKLSNLEIGGEFRLYDLKRSEKKMERSGYFVQIKEPELYRENGRNRLVPLFYMQDASFSYAEGLVSYSSEDNEWVGELDVNLVNLAGTARDLQIKGTTGDVDREISLAYKEPWLLGSAWNGLVRGSLQDDSSYTDAHLELGVERPINFEWTFAFLGGTGNHYWSTAFEISYENLDAFILPRAGTSMASSILFKRSRDSSQYTLVLEGSLEHFVPVYGNFICRSGVAGGYLYPTNADFAANDLFSLGGVHSWKGFRPEFLKTRAYGNAEFALRYQGLARTAFEAFYEPGLYRGRYPEHGWIAEHQYGLGIVQYRDSFSVSIYYALRPGVSLEEGLLHLGVKTLF